MPAPLTRVIIVENHLPLAILLVDILGRESDVQVVGVAQSYGEAVPCLSHAMPAVAIVDWHLPDICGLEITRRLREQFPSTQLILLNDEDEHHYSDVALKRGAAACICKSLVATDLVRAVRKIAGDSSSLK